MVETAPLAGAGVLVVALEIGVGVEVVLGKEMVEKSMRTVLVGLLPMAGTLPTRPEDWGPVGKIEEVSAASEHDVDVAAAAASLEIAEPGWFTAAAAEEALAAGGEDAGGDGPKLGAVRRPEMVAKSSRSVFRGLFPTAGTTPMTPEGFTEGNMDEDSACASASGSAPAPCEWPSCRRCLFIGRTWLIRVLKSWQSGPMRQWVVA